MTKILSSSQKKELEWEAAATRFFVKHPFWGCLSVFVGMPLCVLAAVALCSAAFILLFALLLDWF